MFGLSKKYKLHHSVHITPPKEFVLDYKTKYPLTLYRHMHKKMIECIEAFFEGYPEDKYIFYPPDYEFCDSFFDLREEFLAIHKSDEFEGLPVTNLRMFKPSSNYKDMSRTWKQFKKGVYEDQQMLIKYTPLGYELPDDLQLLLNKLDMLIKAHNEEKNKILKKNHIYPATNYSLPFRKDSIRGKIFNLLAQANSEYVSIQIISQKIKKENNLQYVRIILNQLQKEIERRKLPLKIEPNGKGYYRLININ